MAATGGKEIHIHFEGDDSLRKGFHRFFRRIVGMARERRRRIQFIATNGTPVSDFMSAMRRRPDAINILILDAEQEYGDDLLQRLRSRRDWDPKTGA